MLNSLGGLKERHGPARLGGRTRPRRRRGRRGDDDAASAHGGGRARVKQLTEPFSGDALLGAVRGAVSGEIVFYLRACGACACSTLSTSCIT